MRIGDNHAVCRRELEHLVDGVVRGRIDRRSLFRMAGAMGISLTSLSGLMAQRVGAQGATPAAATPPVAEVRPETRTFSGVEVEDPYFWLEDPTPR